MKLFKKINRWLERTEKSDIKRVRVTSSGAFYMKSEDLFDNNQEALELIEKLDKSVSNFKKANSKKFALTE
ncbi:hypothetical protein QWY99_12380 [Flavobacterium branchiarum]|uniref:Uncharacterized protein n=1 Tax=Flavobacterium branchiarum TaxID=1114870 RepID=A0ABV5FHC7_9FLAO|nr:hypothetical protein [Flavobacterium branchiarum]MDN3673847.1 hypothetical protein [Flavobacterium branchiarum]